MIISDLISLYRTSIRERNFSSSLTDYEIYLIANVCANQIKQQLLDKNHKLGFKSYKNISLDLEKTIFKDSCAPEFMGCKVLKTIEPIPNVLINSFGYEMEVWLDNGKLIPNLSFTKGKRISNHPNLGCYYDIINNYIYIFKNATKYCVNIRAAWEDITKLSEVTGTNNRPCYDPLTDEFPIEEQYLPVVFAQMDNRLNIFTKKPEDETSNFQTS